MDLRILIENSKMAPSSSSSAENRNSAPRPNSSRMASHSSSRSDSNKGSLPRPESARSQVDVNTRGGRRARRRVKEGPGLEGLNALALKQPSYYEDVISLIGISLPIVVTMIPWVFTKVIMCICV
jgi:hypothetical protein